MEAFADDLALDLPFFKIISKSGIPGAEDLCGAVAYSLVVLDDSGATVDPTFAIFIEGQNELRLKPVTND